VTQPRGAAVPVVWGNVPPRLKNFTGRADILIGLREGWNAPVTVLLPHALQGMGGVGKTALAAEYAYRYREDYDLVWWIPADQPALVRASLAGLADRLGLQSAMVGGIESAAAAVLDALRRGDPFERWLLVFDNADQPEDLNDIIPRGPGHVLVTSRNHRWQSVVETTTVDPFTREESKEFFTKRLPRGLRETEADRLAEELGDLPLALEQAGALQAETGMPVDEYLRLLHEHTAQIMSEGRSPEYPRSLTAGSALSVATLRHLLPEAVELLRCFAFFGPEPIPRDIFRRGRHTAETHVSELLADPIQLSRAIGELGRLALIKIDGRSVQVHRLIQALVRDELDPAAAAAYQHEVHLLLAAGAPANPDDQTQWPRFAELVGHVLAPATALPRCTDLLVRQFVLRIIRYLYSSGDRATCLLAAENFVAQWQMDSGPDNYEVLNAQLYLGSTLSGLGQIPAAYEVVETALRRVRDNFGDDNPLTLVLNSAFGASLRARGDFGAALTLDQELLSRYETVFGADHLQTLRALGNVALDYVLTSDYEQARELYERSFVRQSAAEPSAPATDVLTSWSGLALALRHRGNYAAARDVSEEAYDFGREKLGADHYLTVRATIDRSTALRKTGSADEDALEAALGAFEQCTALFGPDNPDTLAAAVSLGNIQGTIGRADQAMALMQSTAKRYEGVFGPDHPYRHCCAGNVAPFLSAADEIQRSREVNEAALAGLDARLTRRHRYSLAIAINLANDLAALGEIDAAGQLGADTLGRLSELLGESHPLSLCCAANLALDLRAGGAIEEADQLHAQTMLRYAASLGSDHPATVAAASGRRGQADFDPPPI
jgi:tetratricopeptide (TPR) repeat protein